MDQSVTRAQYDPGTIRKFKRMSCVAALLIVLLLLRGDRGGGVERSAASPVAKSIDVDAASRDATEATDAAAAAQLVGTLDAARDAAVRLRGVAAAAAHKKRVADRAAAAATGATKPGVANAFERKVKLGDGSEASFSVFGRSDDDVSVFVLPFDSRRKKFTIVEEFHPGPNHTKSSLAPPSTTRARNPPSRGTHTYVRAPPWSSNGGPACK